MTRKRRRLVFVLAGLVLLGGAAAITLSVLGDNLVFFYSPTDLLTRHVPPGRLLRVGGLVADGSVHRIDGAAITFAVTDKAHQVSVTYSGQLPDLFREGQGVVVEGMREADGTIRATTVLAKHDERYMPPEVVDALKRAGRWRENATTAAKAP